ncbi:MAG: hypothetical protein A2233_03780 [Candidatus Kerfeldbacteria bacterium RIFOXYA2_FULL_38_24]|uniref:Uncharacterized protein n=1 Tax=Candidatus Kerfeldbacteria bacterium RIFOXYB2_FULL_38_14 TaxID=1798547 RepID=A0A1G2BAG2_9BACT|nr:MAG: hypothetical protein A2233_03780 [Candidatus Kerfeldbacteria bacterium RIFOXYA2_FULL_38_24]OGY86102.1 MAG: hypothetical protein A2319_01425 [Candidatus Kerfeldbacteria bacterium RIFOXYB2_FULL_38_14]OGY89810.1 MAG: hypothetical protein A2458_05530 [Candidatus Kerfeldbacteria bacterium RIFOXYC2_FULL_38_9]
MITTQKEQKIYFIFRVFLGLGIAVFFLWILNFHFIFLGKLKVSFDFLKANHFISYLQGGATPAWQDIKTKQAFQEIRGGSAVTDLVIPPGTAQLDLKVLADNPGKSFTFGYQAKDQLKKYYIASNPEFTALHWNVKEIDDYAVLYDPQAATPTDLEDLLANRKEETVLYRTPDVLDKYLASQVAASMGGKYFNDLDLPLRGEHTLRVCVGKDGILDLKINYAQKIGEETENVGVHVGFGAYLINPQISKEQLNPRSTGVVKDGVTEFTQDSKNADDLIDIYQEGLLPGSYTLQLKHDNDVTLSHIATHNVFIITDGLVINNPKIPLDVYVFSDSLNLYTFHGGGVQDVKINNDTISLPLKEKIVYQKEKPKKQEENNSTMPLLQVKAERADFSLYSYVPNTIFYPAVFPLEAFKVLQKNIMDDSALHQIIADDQIASAVTKEEEMAEITEDNTEDDAKDKVQHLQHIRYVVFRATPDYLAFLNNPEKPLDNSVYQLTLGSEDLENLTNNTLNMQFLVNGECRVNRIDLVYYRPFWPYLKKML